MVSYVMNTLLDDAYQHLHSALALPDTATGRKQLALFLRIAAVFSWLAVEETTKVASIEFHQRGFREQMPRRLLDRIQVILALRELRTANATATQLAKAVDHVRVRFDDGKFKRMRAVRNDIIHVNAPDTDPATADVKELFEYAKVLIAGLEGKNVLHQHQIVRGKYYL